MSWIDLHMHSICSNDGDFTPEQMVDKCRDAGIRIMAIADHNSCRAVPGARARAEEKGVICIPAIELDCCYEDVDLHVLGYGIDASDVRYAQLEEDLAGQERATSAPRIRMMRERGLVIAEGIVKDITIRHTIIRQFNGECCIVPNSVMDAAVITNTNFIENVGNFMEIEIGYDADIDKAMHEMQRICIENELTLNTEENKVFIKAYTSNGIILKTTVWTKNLDDSFQACSDIRIALVKGFREHNITIPYQTVTIN